MYSMFFLQYGKTQPTIADLNKFYLQMINGAHSLLSILKSFLQTQLVFNDECEISYIRIDFIFFYPWFAFTSMS